MGKEDKGRWKRRTSAKDNEIARQGRIGEGRQSKNEEELLLPYFKCHPNVDMTS